jgi:hypothetical protein
MQQPTVREVARLISEMRRDGASQQDVLFTIDRIYPNLSFREFIAAALIHEIAREPLGIETVH